MGNTWQGMCEGPQASFLEKQKVSAARVQRRWEGVGSEVGARREGKISEGTDGQVAVFGFYSKCKEELLKLPAGARDA